MDDRQCQDFPDSFGSEGPYRNDLPYRQGCDMMSIRLLKCIVLSLGILACADAAAQRAEQPRFGYQRAGAPFACVMRNLQRGPHECDRLGPLHLMDPAATLNGKLPPPSQTLPQGNATVTVHLLGGTAYVAATVVAGKIAALQVTGTSAPPEWTFETIGLGSPSELILSRLGPPFLREPIPRRGTGLWRDGGEFWSYGTWPFSFEVSNGRVISIRLAAP